MSASGGKRTLGIHNQIDRMKIYNLAGDELADVEEVNPGLGLDCVDLSGRDLSSANLAGAVLMDTKLRSSILRGADLYWAILFRADLTGADLRECLLCGADLKETTFVGADLRDANLGKDNLGGSTQLQGANLRDAKLRGTILTDAEYDDATVFPDGFNPRASGMRRVAA